MVSIIFSSLFIFY